MLRIAHTYYIDADRQIVQFQPDCARYDPELTYTLKPSSTCIVTNREHRVEYSANREGLRDDDASLVKPEIVVLGDSHAMGWGVPASEAFPKVIQRDLRVSVLNAAIASYGTARELALLERLRLPPFPVLIIQYSDNDLRENKSLIDNGILRIADEEHYQDEVAVLARRTRYRLFKHLNYLLRTAKWTSPSTRNVGVDTTGVDTNRDEARYFLEILLLHKSLLEGKTVLVLELNGDNSNDDRFTQSVASLLSTGRYGEFRGRVHVVDVSNTLTVSDYYLLDDHMNARGHTKVARSIEGELARLTLERAP
jgi:hypothetical protein